MWLGLFGFNGDWLLMVLAMVSLFGYRLGNSAHLALRDQISHVAPDSCKPQTGTWIDPRSARREPLCGGALEPAGALTLS